MSRPSPSPARLLQFCLRKRCFNRQKMMLRHRGESPLLSMSLIYALFFFLTCQSIDSVNTSLVDAAAGHLLSS